MSDETKTLTCGDCSWFGCSYKATGLGRCYADLPAWLVMLAGVEVLDCNLLRAAAPLPDTCSAFRSREKV